MHCLLQGLQLLLEQRGRASDRGEPQLVLQQCQLSGHNELLSQPQRPKVVENWPNTASCPSLPRGEWPGRCDLYCDGRGLYRLMWLELLSCELLAMSAAAAPGVLINVHYRPPSLKSHISSRVVPLLKTRAFSLAALVWFWCCQLYHGCQKS